jgi:membrane fusion protein, multidrug efflux system
MAPTKKFIFLVLLASLLFSCKKNQDGLDKDISMPVSVMEVKPSGIKNYMEVNGNVAPLKKAELKTEVSGLYQIQMNPRTNHAYKLGDYAEAGKILVKLIDKEFENNIKMESLHLNLEVSKQTYDKQKSLYEKGGVTLSDLKRAEIEYINAKYSFEDASIRLEKLNIRVPFPGVIVELPYHTPGVRVDVGTAIATMMDYSNLIMEVDFPEKELANLHTGQKVQVTNYTLPDDTLTAQISQLSPAVSPDTRSFKGLITVKNPDLLLRPGMFAKADVIISSVDSTVVLSKDIILTKERGHTIFVVEKGLVRERIVSFGIENPDEVQITSGLKIGESVVIKGFETLRDNAKIKVVK